MHRLPLLGSTPWSGLAIKNREGALLLFHSRRFACYQSA
jgi:hypothetical protein